MNGIGGLHWRFLIGPGNIRGDPAGGGLHGRLHLGQGMPRLRGEVRDVFTEWNHDQYSAEGL